MRITNLLCAVSASYALLAILGNNLEVSVCGVCPPAHNRRGAFFTPTEGPLSSGIRALSYGGQAVFYRAFAIKGRTPRPQPPRSRIILSNPSRDKCEKAAWHVRPINYLLKRTQGPALRNKGVFCAYFSNGFREIRLAFSAEAISENTAPRTRNRRHELRFYVTSLKSNSAQAPSRYLGAISPLEESQRGDDIRAPSRQRVALFALASSPELRMGDPPTVKALRQAKTHPSPRPPHIGYAIFHL